MMMMMMMMMMMFCRNMSSYSPDINCYKHTLRTLRKHVPSSVHSLASRCHCLSTASMYVDTDIADTLAQGAYKSGKPGNLREFCNSGKLREFEVCSGNFWSPLL